MARKSPKSRAELREELNKPVEVAEAGIPSGWKSALGKVMSKIRGGGAKSGKSAQEYSDYLAREKRAKDAIEGMRKYNQKRRNRPPGTPAKW